MKKILEMIVDVRRPDSTILTGAWVISTCVEQGGKIKKRWIEPFRNDKIHCGLVGFFDGDNPDRINSDSFHKIETYWDTKYDIAMVKSVHKEEPFRMDPEYDNWSYNIYSPKSGSDQFAMRRGHSNVAKVGNIVLVNSGSIAEKFIANLTVQENIYDLTRGWNLQKYKIWFRNWDNKYLTKSDKPKEVIPAVVCGSSMKDVSKCSVFIPQYSDIKEIKITVEGVWQPLPAPSDIVLLKSIKDDVAVLEENLTLYAENREMNEKFGWNTHRREIAEAMQKQTERE